MDSEFSAPVDRVELNVIEYNLKEKITKLCLLNEKLDASVDRTVVPCDIVDSSWLLQEKCKMIDNIKEDLINSNNDLPQTEGELYIDLYNTFVKENIQLEQSLENLQKELKQQEEKLAKMKEFAKYIELNQEATTTSTINTPDMLDINLIHKNSVIKMQNMRNNLFYLLDLCFKNTNTTNIIKDLTTRYFQGGDHKYIDITGVRKESLLDLEMLRMAGLIMQDPYDKFKIKFDDFI